MHYLYIMTGIALAASLIASRARTGRALVVAFKKFAGILPAFLVMLSLVASALAAVPEESITAWLGGSGGAGGVVVAALVGSVSLMPGFIAFPLAGILLAKGVGYMVLSAFTSTLMMVGILTFPYERAYFGTRVALLRNAISLAIAIVVAIATGLYFGEVL